MKVLVPDATKDPGPASGEARGMAVEIAARLGVRRRLYRAAFALFTAIVLVVDLVLVWSTPAILTLVLVSAGSAILGTGVVLWWAYAVRKSALYEEAGRHLLGSR